LPVLNLPNNNDQSISPLSSAQSQPLGILQLSIFPDGSTVALDLLAYFHFMHQIGKKDEIKNNTTNDATMINNITILSSISK